MPAASASGKSPSGAIVPPQDELDMAGDLQSDAVKLAARTAALQAERQHLLASLSALQAEEAALKHGNRVLAAERDALLTEAGEARAEAAAWDAAAGPAGGQEYGEAGRAVRRAYAEGERKGAEQGRGEAARELARLAAAVEDERQVSEGLRERIGRLEERVRARDEAVRLAAEREGRLALAVDDARKEAEEERRTASRDRDDLAGQVGRERERRREAERERDEARQAAERAARRLEESLGQTQDGTERPASFTVLLPLSPNVPTAPRTPTKPRAPTVTPPRTPTSLAARLAALEQAHAALKAERDAVAAKLAKDHAYWARYKAAVEQQTEARRKRRNERRATAGPADGAPMPATLERILNPPDGDAAAAEPAPATISVLPSRDSDDEPRQERSRSDSTTRQVTVDAEGTTAHHASSGRAVAAVAAASLAMSDTPRHAAGFSAHTSTRASPDKLFPAVKVKDFMARQPEVAGLTSAPVLDLFDSLAQAETSRSSRATTDARAHTRSTAAPQSSVKPRRAASPLKVLFDAQDITANGDQLSAAAESAVTPARAPQISEARKLTTQASRVTPWLGSSVKPRIASSSRRGPAAGSAIDADFDTDIDDDAGASPGVGQASRSRLVRDRGDLRRAALDKAPGGREASSGWQSAAALDTAATASETPRRVGDADTSASAARGLKRDRSFLDMQGLDAAEKARRRKELRHMPDAKRRALYAAYKGKGRYTAPEDLEPNVLDEFVIDPAKNGGVKHQYHETVRGRDERKQMHGTDCECCREWYEAVGPIPQRSIAPRWRDEESGDEDGTDGDDHREALEDHRNRVSRHREVWRKPPTPPDFWQIGFPTTQEVDAINAEAADMARRRDAEVRRQAAHRDSKWKKRE